MRFVAVTACPTGIAHTVMAAEALRRQAQLMGHDLRVETRGAEGTRDELTPEVIRAADAVILAADIAVQPQRFAGKVVTATSTADAIRHPREVLEAAARATYDNDQRIPEARPDAPLANGAAGSGNGASTGNGAGAAAPAATDGAQKHIVGITSCPTGIAHTFMAAEGLREGAKKLGYVIHVETQGSVGVGDELTAADIEAADAVVIAADTKVDLSRFDGKPVYLTGTNPALKDGAAVIRAALEPGVRVHAGGGGDGSTGTPGAAQTGGGGGGGVGGVFKVIYQHVMTGISHMLPLIVAGGLLIAISFAFDINANDPKLVDTFAGRLNQVGSAAFSLYLPVLAGFIAYSIADRPGLAPGFIGGFLASTIQTGFLGAILAGFLAGYVTRELARRIKLPQTLAGLKPVLILPVLATLIVGVTMFYVIGEPVSWVQDQLTDQLKGMQGSNAVVLGAVLGGMMAFDMGGPLNKVAYAFAIGLIDSGVTEPMAAVMVAGMTPPLALGFGTLLFRNRWVAEEREAGKAAFVLGLAFITEGAIPFAARNPARIIPALMAGSAVAGAISLGAGCGSIVPHGGIVCFFVPNALTKGGIWLLALAAGTLVSTAVLFVTTRTAQTRAQAAAGPASTAVAVPA